MENCLGEYVKKKRQAMGLSLREFAKRCDMSHTHIDSIEKGFDMRSGKAVNLTTASLVKLSVALGVTVDELILIQSQKSEPDTDRVIKKALFDDADAPDKWLEEIKRYAEFIKIKGDL